MSTQINAYCDICGKGYHVCKSCEETRSFMPWRNVVDTIDHFKIFLVISDYTNRRITKEEAKKQLEKCNLTEYKNFLPNIVKAIEAIQKESKVKTKRKTTDEKEILDDTNEVANE